MITSDGDEPPGNSGILSRVTVHIGTGFCVHTHTVTHNVMELHGKKGVNSLHIRTVLVNKN